MIRPRMISAAIACSAALLVACGHRDVTTDPSYHFAAMARSQWKLKVPIKVTRLGDGSLVGSLCTEEYATAFAAGTADTRGSMPNESVVAVLPTDTVIRIDRLQTGSAEMGNCYVYLSVQDGKDKGKVLTSPDELFRPNAFITPADSNATSWAINPDKLEKF